MESKRKIALITGASRGIGSQVAIDLAARGIFVIINYSSRSSSAKEVLKKIKDAGGDGIISHFDVSNFVQVSEKIKEIINKVGVINILINNAGITRDTLLLRMKEEDWDKVISVNLKGSFNCTKAVARQMIKHRYGRIVNVTSVVGEMGNPGQTNYSASKAGIVGFTKACAKEFASRGVTVNAVSPGFIETDITANLSDQVRKEYLKRIPLGRFGNIKDVSNLIEFLVSDQASYITGEVIKVNGGLYT
ncbi:MAG: 3-oxoacyl-[acyl-carrier-protein] reductase [Thermodesulfobacteriota bacterium]